MSVLLLLLYGQSQIVKHMYALRSNDILTQVLLVPLQYVPF